jgi:sugar O-acyltransferase (sialic acid O-acetyltransferase NeuD family)
MFLVAGPIDMRDSRIFILGAGGHAKVVLDAVQKLGLSVAGIVNPSLDISPFFSGIQVCGGDEMMDSLDPKFDVIANGLGASPKNLLNKKVSLPWKTHGFKFLTIVHPTTIVGRHVNFGEGCQIMAGCTLQSDISIGVGVVINTASNIDHDCKIGNHTFISPSVVICGGVEVGEDCFIGAGAILLPGVKLGKGVLIAAGAIVDKDVPSLSFINRD